MQEEVTRLKSRLTTTITSAEHTITKAQYDQDDTEQKYRGEIQHLAEVNKSLLDDNMKLRSMIKQSNDDLRSGGSPHCIIPCINIQAHNYTQSYIPT